MKSYSYEYLRMSHEKPGFDACPKSRHLTGAGYANKVVTFVHDDRRSESSNGQSTSLTW